MLQDRGVMFLYVQDHISTSVKGVVRGLHYQKEPFTQAKLVMAVKGEILDVAVDIRKDSPTFGQHFSIELNDKNRRMIDRKSTRLNSSHVAISYAVFCL